MQKRLLTGCVVCEKYFLDGSLNAYTLLKEHAIKHGVTIYNATRGGALEVFDRVDLDDFI